jgi:hypothetical protein
MNLIYALDYCIIKLFKKVYANIPLKQIQTNFPLVFDRITPVMQIYPNRVIGGHSAIVEFHISIISQSYPQCTY